MSNTDQFYTKEEVLLEIPKGRDIVRVMIGHKNLRGEAKTYLDIRAWYRDDADVLCPGKGFAKPMSADEIGSVAKVLQDYASGLCG